MGKPTKRYLFGGRYTLADSTSRVFAGRSRRASVVKWEPGLSGGQDALIKYRYQRGTLGAPSAGGHRPVIKKAGWEMIGATPRAAGSTFDRMQTRKSRAKKSRW